MMHKPPKRRPVHNPSPPLSLTSRQREDARDVAYIKSVKRRGEKFSSWNEFMKELGLNDLVVPQNSTRYGPTLIRGFNPESVE